MTARFVLVWDKRLPVPSNVQGLYRCEYEGDEFTWSAGMKLMKAIRGVQAEHHTSHFGSFARPHC